MTSNEDEQRLYALGFMDDDDRVPLTPEQQAEVLAYWQELGGFPEEVTAIIAGLNAYADHMRNGQMTIGNEIFDQDPS